MILTTYDDIVRHLHFFRDKKLWIEVNGFKLPVTNVEYTSEGVAVTAANGKYIVTEVHSELTEEEFKPKKKKKAKKPLTKESKRSKIEIVKKIGQGRAWL